MHDTAVDRTFEEFAAEMRPRLRRALIGHIDPERVADATSEALAYAWEHWDSVRHLDNAGGYLFRVAQSRSRTRPQGVPPGPDPTRLPNVEPRLGPAMRALPPKQRSAVWLVHACGWTYGEAAEALGISASAVGTHVERGMRRLRSELGADTDD